MNIVERDAKGLLPGQQRAVELLMNEPRLSVVADKLGIDRSTLWHWLKDARFKLHLAEAEAEAINSGTRLIASKYTEAVETVVRAMGGETVTGNQLRAANIILMRLPDLITMTAISVRLAELEARLNDRLGDGQ